MNVLSRKMFQKARPRPARDALNKAGGIMSSSPELMNTVQMYENGGDVFSLTGQRQFGSDGVTQRIPTQPFPEIDFTDIQMTAPKLTSMPPMKKGVAYGGPFGAVAFEKQLLNLQKQSSLYPDKPIVGKIEDPEGKGFPVFEGGKLQGFTTAMEGKKLEPPQKTDIIDMYKKGIVGQVSRELGQKEQEGTTFQDVLDKGLYQAQPRETLLGDIAEYGKKAASVPPFLTALGITGLKNLAKTPGSLYKTVEDENPPMNVDIAGIATDVNRDAPFVPGERTIGVGPSQKQMEEQIQDQERTDRVLGEQDRMQQGQINVDPASSGIQAEIEALNIAMQDKKAMQDRKTDPSLIEQENRGYNAMLDTMTQAERDADITADAATTGEEGGLGSEPTAERVASDVDKNQVSDVDLDIIREEGLMQQGQISRSGENIANSVETGNKDALSSQLKDLMAQFTSNVPKYEGLDKGMAMMKIGFSMAAGKSPYAMQNIANALSSGADMFIKDKSKRDTFNRQVGLSALQYGLGEIGKDKAQQRADVRSIKDYVVGKGGLTMPDGTKFEEGRTVSLNMEQALSLGSDLSNLSSIAAFNTRQAAMTKALTAQLKVIEAQQGKGVKYTDFKSNIEDYGKSLNSAKEAEIAKVFINDALLTVAENDVTSLSAAGKELIRKGGAIFGFDVGEEFKDISTLNRKMNLALNKIIPLVIGDTQSANSISDRDVGFVIKAFLSQGIIEREGGAFKFLGASDDAIALGLKAALVEVNKSQKEDLRTMLSVEDNFDDVMIQGFNKTGTGLLSREITERKQLTGGGGLYYYDPEAQTIGFKE